MVLTAIPTATSIVAVDFDADLYIAHPVAASSLPMRSRL